MSIGKETYIGMEKRNKQLRVVEYPKSRNGGFVLGGSKKVVKES